MSSGNIPVKKDCDITGKCCYSIWKHTFEIDERYVPIKGVGKGAYGVVCSARDKLTGDKVAIKRIASAFSDEVDAIRTLREMNLLRHADHENVIKIKDILCPVSKEKFNDVYIVYECMDTDLHQIIRSPQPLTDEHFQYFIWQILRGLKYLHSANIIHRDLKPSNLLLNADCDLKICDFGLARASKDQMDLTGYVVTRWYRAPEVLFSKHYSTAIDMWSVGCIMGELLQRKPLFEGKDFQETMKKALAVLGPPTNEDLSFIENPTGKMFIKSMLVPGANNRRPFKERFPNANPHAVDLLEKLLQLDPRKRPTAAEALKHPWLASLHDEKFEPIAKNPFEYEFDEEDLTTSDIRDLVYREVMFWKAKNDPSSQSNSKPCTQDLDQKNNAKDTRKNEKPPTETAEKSPPAQSPQPSEKKDAAKPLSPARNSDSRPQSTA